jgi:hypothetical protein
MWLIQMRGFETPSEPRPELSVSPKERDIMTHEQLTVSVAIASWKNTVGRADKVFSALTDEQFLQEVAPGRNRIIYLLGHLTTVHDGLHTILGLGERLHPEFESMFVSKPDKAIKTLPSISQLKQSWTVVNHSLLEKFDRLSPENWLQRHMAMSDEDYAKDPTRNRLSVLLSRTNHLSYHLGQIILAPR